MFDHDLPVSCGRSGRIWLRPEIIRHIICYLDHGSIRNGSNGLVPGKIAFVFVGITCESTAAAADLLPLIEVVGVSLQGIMIVRVVRQFAGPVVVFPESRDRWIEPSWFRTRDFGFARRLSGVGQR